jgi:hypothetical protein
MEFWWVIYEDVAAKSNGSSVDVVRLSVPTAAKVTEANGRVLVNGEFFDFGDDYPCLLGLMDAARAHDGRWVVVPTEI